MAFEASAMLEILVLITWACLVVPVHKHPVSMQIFPSKAVLSDVISAGSLDFCPSLFDSINAPNPPALSFFKSLPSDNFKDGASMSSSWRS